MFCLEIKSVIKLRDIYRDYMLTDKLNKCITHDISDYNKTKYVNLLT